MTVGLEDSGSGIIGADRAHTLWVWGYLNSYLFAQRIWPVPVGVLVALACILAPRSPPL